MAGWISPTLRRASHNDQPPPQLHAGVRKNDPQKVGGSANQNVSSATESKGQSGKKGFSDSLVGANEAVSDNFGNP